MNRRLKIAVGLLVALGVIHAGASWYAGRLARHYLESAVEQANQALREEWHASDPRPVLRLEDYRQGVFTSDMRYTFDFHDAQGRPRTLSVHNALQHGPWPWATLRTGIWQAVAAYSQVEPLPGGLQQAWFDAMPQGTLPWVMQARIGFDGKVVSVWHFMPVPAHAAGWSSSGGTLRASHDPHTGRTLVSGQVDFLALQNPETGVQSRLEGLAIEAEVTRPNDSVLQSRFKLHLARMRLLGAGLPELTLVQPTVSVLAARTGSLLDTRVEYSHQALQTGQQDQGQMQVTLSTEHVDTQALQALSLALDQVELDADGAPVLSDEAERHLLVLAMPVLASSPRVTLNTLRWTNAKGSSELKAQAEFQPVADPLPQSMDELLERGLRQVVAQLRISRPMLVQVLVQGQSPADPDTAAALFNMLLNHYAGRLQRLGLIRQEGKDLLADFRYGDGQLTVNGSPMSPAELSRRIGSVLGSLPAAAGPTGSDSAADSGDSNGAAD